MSRQRPGLWVEIALALALITLATIILNAGVFWLLLKKTEEDRRSDLALSLSAALTAQLEIEALRQDEAPARTPYAGYRRVLSAYEGAGLDFEALYVVDRSMKTVASVAGQAPSVPDAGLRSALYGREQHIDVDGVLWGQRWVEVTSPVAPRGDAVAALRVRMPLVTSGVPGGPAGFVLLYTVSSGFAIALFGFALFRSRLLNPLGIIQEGTRRIAAGEFGHSVEVEASRELAELTAALNTMSASLMAYRERTAEQVRDLERANQELRRAQEALVRSERLAGVGRLAAGLAHEVGNPLAAVLGYVELLQQDLGDPALEADLIGRSQRELERIHAIIRQLLGYARLGSGEPELVDLGDAITEALRTVSPLPAFRGVKVERSVAPDLPQVRLERDKLHQVLVNLLLNAGDAVSRAERKEVSIYALAVPGGWVELRCEDSGPGFDAVSLDRAFEPFFTTKDVGSGTGLGLATCLQVVEGAGGTIVAKNRPGGGACLRLQWPAARP